MSVTEIKYNERSSSLEILTRFFIDDLEEAVQLEQGHNHLDILIPPQGLTTAQLIESYLKRHLYIKLDGIQQSLSFIGHEVEDFSIIYYMEIENVKNITHINVTHTSLMNIYENQSNLVHVTYQKTVKSARLNRKTPSKDFSFK